MGRREREGRRGKARAGAPQRTKARPQPKPPAARPRPARRVFPPVVAEAPAPPRVGEWLLTTRPGAEQDLVDELYFLDARCGPRLSGPSLVSVRARPVRHKALVELAFARQGFVVADVVAAQPDDLAAVIAPRLNELARGRRVAWALDVWVPDADATNKLAATAAHLQVATVGVLEGRLPEWTAARAEDARGALADNGLYAQVCLLGDGTAAAGVTWAREAPSLAPGGRLRVHVPEAAPSRAAMKLVEALTWLDRAPEPGDLCVDLGASPGGWTWVLLERRAKVIAVDPGPLAPSVRGRKGVEHVRGDAFKFEPPEAVDWLLCDMAYRPLEVAGLLAKWARREWARLLIANFKLPMKKKAEMLFRVRDILEDGGWRTLRARQLYHDREEVTIAGVRL